MVTHGSRWLGLPELVDLLPPDARGQRGVPVLRGPTVGRHALCRSSRWRRVLRVQRRRMPDAARCRIRGWGRIAGRTSRYKRQKEIAEQVVAVVAYEGKERSPSEAVDRAMPLRIGPRLRGLLRPLAQGRAGRRRPKRSCVRATPHSCAATHPTSSTRGTLARGRRRSGSTRSKSGWASRSSPAKPRRGRRRSRVHRPLSHRPCSGEPPPRAKSFRPRRRTLVVR